MCSLHILTLYLLFQTAAELTAESFGHRGWVGVGVRFKSTYNNKTMRYVKTEMDSNTTQHSFKVSQTTKTTVRSVFYSALMHPWLSKSSFWTQGYNSSIFFAAFFLPAFPDELPEVWGQHTLSSKITVPMRQRIKCDDWLLVTPPVTTGSTARESLLYTEPQENIQGFKMDPLL